MKSRKMTSTMMRVIEELIDAVCWELSLFDADFDLYQSFTYLFYFSFIHVFFS